MIQCNLMFIGVKKFNNSSGYGTLLYGVESNCYFKHMNWLPSICKYQVEVTPPLPLLKVSSLEIQLSRFFKILSFLDFFFNECIAFLKDNLSICFVYKLSQVLNLDTKLNSCCFCSYCN